MIARTSRGEFFGKSRRALDLAAERRFVDEQQIVNQILRIVREQSGGKVVVIV